MSELLVLRAYAANGDTDAAASLESVCERMAMPGLTAGL